uniref:Uncharacterized protein n=1 Tax=Anguilla anguilla TaxID=7936 RepID=A0A0E9SHZ4_ANGAN
MVPLWKMHCCETYLLYFQKVHLFTVCSISVRDTGNRSCSLVPE